jgi:hypothetical protein
VLLVLDDVWNAKHVSYFQTHGARFCRLLLTTRDADIGKATGAQSHPLDVLTRELSRRMVANYAGLSEDELPGEADGIVVLDLLEGLLESLRNTFADVGIRMGCVVLDARFQDPDSLHNPCFLGVAVLEKFFASPSESGLTGVFC